MTKAVASTTLEQLLTMMGGFTDQDPGPTVTDWVADILDKQAVDPGSEFTYSSNSAHLVSTILAEATGMPVLDYARAKLFDPLGIPSTPAAQQNINDPDAWDGPGFGWAVDPQGINVGGFGLRLRAQDMAKLGLLYLHNGLWDGQQVVPADWVHQATIKHADTRRGRIRLPVVGRPRQRRPGVPGRRPRRAADLRDPQPRTCRRLPGVDRPRDRPCRTASPGEDRRHLLHTHRTHVQVVTSDGHHGAPPHPAQASCRPTRPSQSRRRCTTPSGAPRVDKRQDEAVRQGRGRGMEFTSSAQARMAMG